MRATSNESTRLKCELEKLGDFCEIRRVTSDFRGWYRLPFDVIQLSELVLPKEIVALFQAVKSEKN